MSQAVRIGVSSVSVLAYGLLAFFLLVTAPKLVKESGRFTRLEVAQPLSKYTAFSNYNNQHLQLQMAQVMSIGSPTFRNIPCDWWPFIGGPSLPIHASPDFPLYFITPQVLPFFGYATEAAQLAAIGATKMMCLPSDLNKTLCDCNVELSYADPGRFLAKSVYQGTIFKYYNGDIMAEVWVDSDGVMLDKDGNRAKPKCATDAKQRKSNTKSWRVDFANHYMNSYVCVDHDIEVSDRVNAQGNTFLALTILFAIFAALLAIAFALWPMGLGEAYAVAPASPPKPIK